jgi:hypothetical protein
MSQSLAYFMHDMMNVNRNQSIQVIGQLAPTDLAQMHTYFPPCEAIGWDFTERMQNVGVSEAAGIAVDVFAHEDFLSFNVDEECPEFENFLNENYPLLADVSSTYMFCEASYAQMHDDSNLSSRGQLMFILSNPSKHSFISIDDNGVKHEIIPEAGDILFLDIACRHALFPKQVNVSDLQSVKPLKMAMISINGF